MVFRGWFVGMAWSACVALRCGQLINNHVSSSRLAMDKTSVQGVVMLGVHLKTHCRRISLASPRPGSVADTLDWLVDGARTTHIPSVRGGKNVYPPTHQVAREAGPSSLPSRPEVPSSPATLREQRR